MVPDEAGCAILCYNYLCGMNFDGQFVREPHHYEVGSTEPNADASDFYQL